MRRGRGRERRHRGLSFLCFFPCDEREKGALAEEHEERKAKKKEKKGEVSATEKRESN